MNTKRTSFRRLVLAVSLTWSVPLHAVSTIQFSTTIYNAIEGADHVDISVVRTNDLASMVSVDFTNTTNGTATAGTDYIAVSTKLTFLASETNKVVSVPILNDGLVEGTETFQVILSNPTVGAELGQRTTATVRIADNDKGLQLELPSYSVNEDSGAFTVRVLRRDDGDFPVLVDFATTSLTALPGKDYLDTSGTLTFVRGETLKKVTVTLLNDAIWEPSKTFRITLSNPSGGGVLGVPIAATVTITDTDDLIEFQSASVTTREDSAFKRIAVVRGESVTATTVNLATVNGNAIAGQDYVGMTNTISFAPSERMKFVDIPIINDGLKEPSETFRVALIIPTGGAVLGPKRSVTVTILDNDPGVGFERSTNSVRASLAGLTLNVTRGNDGWQGPFTVDYRTVDGAAVGGVDFETASGTLSFGANEMVREIPVRLLRNPASKPARYFTVALTNVTGQIPLGRSTTRVSIVDSLDLTQPAMSGGIEKEGGGILVFWPELSSLSRANSVTGPWEQLGTLESPLLSAPELPGAFYQLRSPRSARIYVPSNYDGRTPVPLVLVLHGYGGDAAVYADYFRMEPLAEARGFLVCHPEGTVGSQSSRFWNATDACCNFYGATVDDSAYLRGLIEEVARQYSVDRKRVYVTGHSNGGYMSHRMACDHPDLIAGIASLAGMTFLDLSTIRPSQPVNVLQIHGTADEVVPYGGGALLAGLPVVALFPGAIATVQSWAAFNGCQGAIFDTQPSMDLDLDVPGLDTIVMRYTNSPPGGAVELWTINGGKHSPTFFSGTRSSEYSARVIDWLLAHPKP